ncbi:glycosyltransferase [Microbacterium sp. 67-17]|uniref:glycosyltransferase n=1 Tax=Microbacterium sp. 67-17 TaxID=1895782 RepID=UPI0025DB5968|nr:glycosyltransferase [Microbacterium sp. 67-17]
MATLDSPDGAFGGPTRVAHTQCAELARQGHVVDLAVGSPREGVGQFDGGGYGILRFRARKLAPVGGFASLVSWPMLRWLRDNVKNYDAIHVHLARDLVTLPAASIAQAADIPVFAQTHGMVDPSKRMSARVVDLLATRRVLRHSRVVFALTAAEEVDLAGVEPAVKVRRVVNGVAIPDRQPVRVVRESGTREVLFLARLHERKRPVAFVEMAAIVSRQLSDVQFTIAGPDEGELAAVSDTISRLALEDRVRVVGPLAPESTDAAMARADVFVLPSTGEVFPMTVLEAFRVGTPAVVTDSLGIADECRRAGAAVVTDGSASALASAVSELLGDATAAKRQAEAAYHLLHSTMTIRSAVSPILEAYGEAE